ncbi:MAG: succinate dehydrogenase assembly factor 2 [Gammaproteobacteria bacterium]|nr:succinate dehydrogenase assembly factor 2 [Gammaproteobacteria bacterium]NNJ95454.1 succinate dehydrogenase assembly factor 2 [Halobacteria archaeon]
MNAPYGTDHAANNRTAWQCRRGMRELDELLGQFLELRYTDLDACDRSTFNTLLEYPDAVLLELLMGRMAPADGNIARLVRAIRDTAAH